MNSLPSAIASTMRSVALAALLIAGVQAVAFLPAHATATQSITLNAGESHVIDNVNFGSPPSLKFINNSHALVMHADAASRKRHEDMGFHNGWSAALDQLIRLAKSM